MKTFRDRFVESFAADPVARRGRKRSSGGGEDMNGVILKNSAALTFLGLTLGTFISRKFLVVPVAVLVTLAQEFGKDRLLEKAGRRTSP
jgi:hypothetical protein